MPAVDDRVARCPVCPFRGLGAEDLRCPVCGTDLTALRRVQELPLALLDDALVALEAGDLTTATSRARAASAFPPARAGALLVLGDVRARRGSLRGAAVAWRAAARAGAKDEATERLTALARLPYRTRVHLVAGRLRRHPR